MCIVTDNLEQERVSKEGGWVTVTRSAQQNCRVSTAMNVLE